VLRDAGYQVVASGDGVAAEAAGNAQDRLDVLLTDVVMPERSGYDLARRVGERWPGLATVFMSGYVEDTGEVGWRPTPHWFLPKPFTIEQLLSTVEQACRHRRSASA